MPKARSSGTPSRHVISGKRFVVITKEGVEFATVRYCSSTSPPNIEIELYGFLLRLLSFGGILPLVVVKRWRRTNILKRALENKFVVVTPSVQVLPKKMVKKAMTEIWGRTPKSIYV
jgi:hypothetical protein